MTEMQAAIGRIQIKRMPDWHRARKQNAAAILRTCDQFPTVIRAPRPPEHIEHAWYKCYLFIRPDGLRDGWTRDRIMEEINAKGVPCYAGSCSEVYLEKAFDHTDWRPRQRLPVAKELGETSLMFLVHPGLSDEAMSKTCLVIEQVINNASN
jgi:dTDP-4-amino-4,6-dideoxygalactose transaminase